MEGSISKRNKLRRILLYIVGALYLSTWIWGIPAAHTTIADNIVTYYKQALQQRPKGVRPQHPYLRFGASYAILPFVMVNHYEYSVAGLWGWGGFTIDVWYFKGTKSIFGITKWVS